MAEQLLPAYEVSERYPWAGMRLMRAFRIAVDIRKLFLAAVGMILVAEGDWMFASLPFAPQPASPTARRELGPLEAARQGLVSPELPAEMIRVAEWTPATLWRMTTQWNTVLRPVRAIIDPAVILLKPGVTWSEGAWGITRLLWALIVWGIFGGAIVRMAAVQFARDVKLSVPAALKFSVGKLLSYLCAPLLPLTGIAGLCALCGLGGLIGRIPEAGPVIVACAWGVALALGFLMLLMLIGVAVGWPLMWAAISTEGSDAFDGFSRSYSFVYSRPWHYLVYGLTAVVYGSVVTIFLTAVFGGIVHLAAWGVGTGMGGAAVGDLHTTTAPLVTSPNPASAASGETPGLATHIVSGWMVFVSILLSGFSYSFFWTASTIVYFLLRNSDDATRFDEVWLPEEEEKDDLLPLVGVAASEQPVVERPVRRPDERAEPVSEGATSEGAG